MNTYTFETSGPVIVASVTPTMQALGDQPWLVELSFDNPAYSPASRVIEEGCALLAAREAVQGWLERQGMPTSFIVS